MRDIIAGPWVGEFGWELMGWQGWLRAQKKEGDHFTIICQSGHEYLYQDFADEFINYDPDIKDRTMWMAKGHVPDKSAISGTWSHAQNSEGTPVIYDPQILYKKQWLTLKPDSPEQKFIKFGDGINGWEKSVKAVMIHARSVDKLNTGCKNWSAYAWRDLVDMLNIDGYHVCSIGAPGQALHIPGTSNDIGMDLKKLCNLLRTSKLVIGPSSGPIHLATLCGTPHLTWTGHSRMPERHEKTWNPLNTDCHCIWSGGNHWDEGKEWQPTVHEIYHAAKLVLSCE